MNYYSRVKLSFLRSAYPPILSLILPTHANFISSPLPPLPECASASPSNHPLPTHRTFLRAVGALPTAPAADHAFRPLVDMFFCLVVALVAGVDLLATAESEPA